MKTTNQYIHDLFMRIFVRQSIKGERCVALNQFYKSSIWDEVFNIISKELGLNGNLCETLDKVFEYTKKQRKLLEDEYDSEFTTKTTMKKKEPNILTKNLTN